MEEAKLRTLAQVKVFLDGTSEVAFRVPKEGRNQFIERVLKRFGYAQHGRVAALYRAHDRAVTPAGERLVRRYRKDGKLTQRQGMAPKHGFTCLYTAADVALLAEIDTLHSTLCPDPPPRSSWNAPCECLAMRVSNGWRAFRFPLCTTCAAALDQDKPDVRHSRMGCRATSASTASTKAIRTA